MDKILVIGAGKYQLSSILKLKDKGYYVIAFDGNENAEGKESVDEFYCIDILDSVKVIEFIKKLDISIISAMSFATDAALKTVASINEYFDLIGIKNKDIFTSTNKEWQREIQKRNNLLHPNFICISDSDNIEELRIDEVIKFPLIVKPLDGSGSRGVHYVNSKRDLLNSIKDALSYSRSKKVLVEQYIPGIEITVESIMIKGRLYTLGISEKKKPLDNRTVSYELFYFSPFINSQIDEIEKSVNEFLLMCNIDNTIIHTELMYSFLDHKYYVIESSVRSGGFYISDKVLPGITGLDVVGINIDTLLNKCNDLGSFKRKSCILRFFHSHQGRINKIIERKNLLSNLEDIEYGFFVNEGDIVGPVSSDSSRLGYMIVFGDRWDEALYKASIIDYAVEFEII